MKIRISNCIRAIHNDNDDNDDDDGGGGGGDAVQAARR